MTVTAVVGGTVITPHGARRTDVLISRGKVAALGDAGAAGIAGGAGGAPGAAAGGRIDAAGCFVLPGGVDPHAHLMADVRHATAGAALGGTTTALSFTNPAAGEGDVACLLRRRRELAGVRPVVDVGLHAMLYHPQEVSPADLAAARRAGAAAVKVFLAYPELGIMCSTRRLFELMSAAMRLGLAVQVHCENGHLIEALVADALRSGATGPRAFAQTKPNGRRGRQGGVKAFGQVRPGGRGGQRVKSQAMQRAVRNEHQPLNARRQRLHHRPHHCVVQRDAGQLL